MKPLLSIIIPTKDRYNTLGCVVNGLLPYLSDLTEIVIQDNSVDNSPYFDLGITSNRVSYFYNNESLPISENTIQAIEHAKGEYLLFIGDDDFVSPRIEEIAKAVNDKAVDCLIYDAGYYWWDSVKFARSDYYNDNDLLLIKSGILSMDIRFLDSKVQLQKVLDRGAIDYNGLPRFYHGIVKRNILDQLKKKCGTYLIGSCPDMSFAISLSLLLDKFAYMNYPVTVFGASKGSGGGLTASKKHFSKIEDATFLRSDIIDKWDNNIPLIWSQKTIYPQTTHEVLLAFRSDYKINYKAFYASMLFYEPYLITYLWPKMRQCLINPLFIYQLLRKFIGFWTDYFIKKLKLRKVRRFTSVKAND
ncbi:glycosyltransferase family 2 protein, partial [Mediterranea massiliensis]|uniref:glycosyltransferase family 2 protein n=1 Tax=Mediterranea massiliensis TaxID=1841865 RepID=UPI0025A4067D